MKNLNTLLNLAIEECYDDVALDDVPYIDDFYISDFDGMELINNIEESYWNE